MKRSMTAVRAFLAGSLCLAGLSGLAGCGAAPASGSVNVPSTIEVANVEDQVISVTASEEVKGPGNPGHVHSDLQLQSVSHLRLGERTDHHRIYHGDGDHSL